MSRAGPRARPARGPTRRPARARPGGRRWSSSCRRGRLPSARRGASQLGEAPAREGRDVGRKLGRHGRIVGVDCSAGPGDAPDAPQRRRIRQRVAVDEDEVGRAALADDAGVRLAEELAAAPRRRARAPPTARARPPTSDSTSQASWFARSEPPPKSVPVAIRTPARWAARTDASAFSRRAAIAARPSAPVNRSIVVVVAERRPRPEAPRGSRRGTSRAAAISAARSSSSSKPCSIASTPPATPFRAPSIRPLCAVTRAPRAWTAATTARRSRRPTTGRPPDPAPSR